MRSCCPHVARVGAFFLLAALLAVGVGPAANASADRTSRFYEKFVLLRDGTDATRVAAELSIVPLRTYQNVLVGFSAHLNDADIGRLAAHSQVLAVEDDNVVFTAETQKIRRDGLYALDRIDQERLPLSGDYSFTASGRGVAVYVVDTGVDSAHVDFAGRAAVGTDVLGGDGSDCNGHGTGVAALIGGARYGVAKSVDIRGVRALDCDGRGTISSVVAGLDWVRANARRPAIVNVSIETGRSHVLDTAVRRLTASGLVVVSAAGNRSADACRSSPAGASSAITVAASDSLDSRAEFSNHGTCVDLYAPGVAVETAAVGGGRSVRSGTSFSAPLVTGVAALVLEREPVLGYRAVAERLLSGASAGVVRGNVDGTPNLLVNKRDL